MKDGVRIFVSFSSRDLTYVREIMAALEGQQIPHWDYSDIIQSIEIGQDILQRLYDEIDCCSHMIVVISKNSMDPRIGHFCQLELEYARKRKDQGGIEFLPVTLEPTDEKNLLPPYDWFKKDHIDQLDSSVESIICLTERICNRIRKLYLPPIKAHPNMPSWEKFRKEVHELAHSNKDHTDLMTVLGEFNGHYSRRSMDRALFLIRHFIDTCTFKNLDYKPFYPLIIKAATESEMGRYETALESYAGAGEIDPECEDVIGGTGTVYSKSERFQEAIACFDRIIQRNKPGDHIEIARINRVITIITMGEELTSEDQDFSLSVDPSKYADELKMNILNVQGVVLFSRKAYSILEKHCWTMIADNLDNTTTNRILQLVYLNQGEVSKGEDVIRDAIARAKENMFLDVEQLKGYL